MRQKIELKAHVLRDVRLDGWEEEIVGRWHYNDLVADPTWRKGWISFDAVTYNPHDDSIYCGLNSLDGDLLYRFSPASQDFTGLGTQRWADQFDAKIHRTMLLHTGDQHLYFGTSLLHDADRQQNARGGKLVRYDWRNDRYDVLTTPLPPLYLQSIALDDRRDILYAFTYPAELLVRYDLQTGTCSTLAYLGNATMLAQPHNAVIDRDGWLWGTYAETRAWDEVTGPHPIRLFKYHPDENKFVWFGHGLACKADDSQLCPDPQHVTRELADMTESRHKQDFGFCDSMAYDGGRYIYAGTVAGVLCRIDIETAKVEKIANVMESGRFPALGFGAEGELYGAGGMRSQCQICRFDPMAEKLDVWSDLADLERQEKPARIHELAVSADGTLWLGENDNHKRSSYLWSMQVPD